jgi:hypothetical protein
VRFSRKGLTKIQLGAAFSLALSAPCAFAYHHPLSDDEVREAYFIGQDAFKVNTFLARYTQAPPLPDTGPQIAEIAMSTPYEQVVEVSAQHTLGYTEGDAAVDYKERGDCMVVRLKVLLTPTYSTNDGDFWRSISVGLIQNGKHLAATRVDGQPIYSGDSVGDSQLVGANLQIQFSITGVRSDSVQVEVVPPGGPRVRAAFDLNSLP